MDAASGGAAKGAGPASGKPKALPDVKKGKSLKRPGSPNLSEMESSGNESSRKRAKKQATGSVPGSRSSTPLPSSQRAKLATGAMSDGEATGGEMSDAGRAKKKGHKVTVVSGTHGKGTPTGSRAGSPAPAASQAPPSGMCLAAASPPSSTLVCAQKSCCRVADGYGIQVLNRPRVAFSTSHSPRDLSV